MNDLPKIDVTELTEAPEPKPWYLSRTALAGLVAILAGGLRLVGLSVDEGTLLGLVQDAVPILAGAVALYGRTQATSPIRWT